MIIIIKSECVKCNFPACYKNFEGEKTLNIFDTIKQIILISMEIF